MFLQEATPNTSAYMIAGYVVAFIVMALYVLSIYLRSRNLHQDLTLLEEMEKESTATKKMPTGQSQVNPAKAVQKKSQQG
jgi:hypothetical protein